MPLLERERCLADLGAWLDAAAAGSGSIVLVGGEAGIGKTALLQTFASSLTGVRVLWGNCDALFTPRALGPLQDIARQTKGRLLDALSAGRDPAFAALLDNLEAGELTLLVCEDLHWADEATLDMLKFLGRRLHRCRALLIVSYREDEVGAQHPLRSVLGNLPRACTHRLTLAPLSEVAVNRMANEARRAPSGLHATTGGNPFFVTEVLGAEGSDVPVTVRDAVLGRMASLSLEARAIAERVCVVPGWAEGWLLGEGQANEAAIDSCLAAGMRRDTQGRLCFRHELARRAFLDSLSSSRQRVLHGQILDALSARPDIVAARLAHHADGAARGLQVLQFAQLAAASAVALGAHREAVSHYRLALRHAQMLEPPVRARLLEQLSYECYLTNQPEEAIQARQAALLIWRAEHAPLKEGDTLRWLSRLAWFTGQRAEAARYAGQAVEVLQGLAPGEELAMAYSNLAQLHMLASESQAAICWADRAIELGETLQSLAILSHAYNNRGTARLGLDDPRGVQDLQQSLQLALAGEFQEHVARAYTNLAWTAVVARRYAQAQPWLDARAAVL